MNRRTILIIAIVLILIAAGVLVYFLFFRGGGETIPPGGTLPPTETPSGENPQETPGGQETPSPTGGGGPGSSPSAGQKFFVAANAPTHDFFVDQKNEITLIQPDGQIMQAGSGGNLSALSSAVIASLSRASFSSDGKKIVASFGDSASPQLSIFDVPSKTWKPLDSKIQNPSWGPKANEMVYFVSRGDQSSLESLDVANPKAKPVEFVKLRVQDLVPRWINPNHVLLTEKASASFRSSLWKFDIKTGTLTPVAKDLSGLESAWSASGNRAVISSVGASTGKGNSLQLIDGQGKILYQLKFETLAPKCVFSGTAAGDSGKFSMGDKVQTTSNLKVRQASSPTGTLLGTQTKKATGEIIGGPTSAGGYVWWQINYDKGPDGWSVEDWLEYAEGSTPKLSASSKDFVYCAIPRDAQKLGASVLPDDYYKMRFFTSDDFYQIDLSNGNASPIFADPGQTIDASNLKIFNNELFFVNRYDQKLYAITLPE